MQSYAEMWWTHAAVAQPVDLRSQNIEGVAGPEAANNATVTAAMIPLLTLGIPTSTTAATGL